MKDNTVLACVGLFVVVVVTALTSAVMNGWVLSVLWGWFVVPLFSVPPLSVAAAIGFALVVGLLTHQDTGNSSDGKTKDWSDVIAVVLAKAVFAPLATLAIGYVVKSFV